MTAIAQLPPDNFAFRINHYVPAMQCAADVHQNGIYRIGLGTPAVADTDGILDGTAITDSASTIDIPTASQELDATFGRAVQIVGGTAGDDAVVTVIGKDYLGQPMRENLTLNGTTGVVGKKAFKWVTQLSVAAGNGNASSTIDFGTLDVLGLPYKTTAVLLEEGPAGTPQSAGTFVGPVLTDPQTATTGDPRGTYNPTVTLTGAVEVVVTAVADTSVNSSGNGGLHGIVHFSG